MSSRRGTANEIVTTLTAQGWRYRRGGGGHGVLYPPDGSRPIAVSFSPGSEEALTALRQRVRKAGGKL
jgi:predicted RNA binding protein YcfA (HicA-like mRNA interferase family)